mmetsp:Transcript_4669/g.14586  ORF Transcript_4669/g.14586 Transcript_4669/m.14586 type:complete len:122 (+) Transcript_4669:227-592(+)
MLNKKHRYLVVDTRESGASTAAAVVGYVRQRILAESGEFGLGIADPQVRFFDRSANLALVRVARSASASFVRATRLPVLATHGSVRTARPRAARLLRDRHHPGDDDDALQAQLALLQRAQN